MLFFCGFALDRAGQGFDRAGQILREMGRAFAEREESSRTKALLVRDLARVRRANWAFVCEDTSCVGLRVSAGRNGSSYAKTLFGWDCACPQGEMGLRMRRHFLRGTRRVSQGEMGLRMRRHFLRGTRRVFRRAKWALVCAYAETLAGRSAARNVTNHKRRRERRHTASRITVGAPRWPEASAWVSPAPAARSARTRAAPCCPKHGASLTIEWVSKGGDTASAGAN